MKTDCRRLRIRFRVRNSAASECDSLATQGEAPAQKALRRGNDLLVPVDGRLTKGWPSESGLQTSKSAGDSSCVDVRLPRTAALQDGLPRLFQPKHRVRSIRTPVLRSLRAKAPSAAETGRLIPNPSRKGGRYVVADNNSATPPVQRRPSLSAPVRRDRLIHDDLQGVLAYQRHERYERSKPSLPW